MLPDELKRLRQWLVWKFQPDPSGKKPRKVPHYVSGVQRNGTQGSPEDRTQLATFDAALVAYEAGGYDGLGLAMLPEAGLVGVDEDHCVADGKVKPEYAELIAGTYAELSPSDKGVRAFYFGTYADRKHLEKGVEIFCGKGFLTITGNRINANPIIPLPDAVRAKFDRIFSAQKAKSSQSQTLNEAEVNDPVFCRLKELGMVRKDCGSGKYWITCPNIAKHTSGDGDGDCCYYLPHTNGYERGNFHCLHAHCTELSQAEFKRLIGIEAGDGWPDLLPLGPEDPPPLPIDLWPPVLCDYATEAAAETETPIELPAMMALGCVAAAVQRVATIEIKPGYQEPCGLYVCVVLPPAARKSAEARRATRPIVCWEAEMRKYFATRIEAAESRLATHKARVSELRKQAARAKDGARAAELAEELAELEAAAPTVPSPPRIFTSDVTPEHLATMMDQNDGVMALISSEGGIFETMAGRYSNQIPNLDIYLMGHAGDHVRVDRGSRPAVIMDNPRLTMALTIQPDVLAAMSTKPGFRGRGLLGRVLFCLPTSTIGRRNGATRPMRADVQAAYDRTVTELLDASHTANPYTLQIEPEAFDAWLAYWREVEAELAEGGRFECMRDWAGKLPGAVGRIAALFHSARYPSALNTRQVCAEDMLAAIETGRALAQHALAAFGQMGADLAVEDANILLGWIKRHQLADFAPRDAQRNYGSRFSTADELEPALRVFTDAGYVRQRKVGSGAKGGRPSIRFEVNPALFR